MSEFQMLGYIAVAMLFGAVVGADREAARKPAGLRTHMLVSGVAALLVLSGQLMVRSYGEKAGGHFVSDPIHVIEAIITGVSFLGAGTIIRNRGEQVEGLTTAASLLWAAAIGVCVALGQLTVAVGVTLFILCVLRLLGYIETRLQQPAVSPAKGAP